MSRPVISVDSLSKAYRIGLKDSMHDTLVGAIRHMIRAPFKNWRQLNRLDTFRNNGDAEDIFWALKDVSFEVQEGEVLGIIGRNGAGKSTLLKVLSRITEPTCGRAVIRGRVSSLLEVGTGFHPELTGRENIYMNGTILGMTKREIDRKLDAIIDFSGVEQFLDTPVKRYSSGMKVRLAFSVAAHLEPEILIIDEVLAVGDVEFQKKCLGKMHSVADSGRTVLFVSHNMVAVEGLCTRGLLLTAGSLILDGAVNNVLQAYHQHGQSQSNGAGHRFKLSNELADGLDGFILHELRIASQGVIRDEGYAVGAPLEFQLDCETEFEIVKPVVCIRIQTRSGHIITELHSLRCGARLPARLTGRFAISCSVPELLLTPGDYIIRVAFKAQGEWFFIADGAGPMTILPTDFYGTGKGVSIPNVHILCRQSWATAGVSQNECGSNNDHNFSLSVVPL